MPSSTVLIAAGCPHATTTLYRCVHLQEQLVQNGFDAVVQEWRDDVGLPLEQVVGYDILVLQRVAMSAHLQRIIEALHAQGKVVIFDTDDLVFEPTMTQWHRGVARLAAPEQALYAAGVRRYLATLEASDYVLTASPLLAELAQRRGKTAFVHRNAVGREMQAWADQLWAQRQQRDGTSGAPAKVVIGYGSGTPTHDVDFAEVAPALLDVMARHPQVELWLVGPLQTPPMLEVFATRIRRFPLGDWRRWFELASTFDINLAPLEMGNIFCQAKSEIKFVEAGLFGVPTVASRIAPFVAAITPGQDGLLAGNVAAWIDALELLISQPALRKAMGEAARRTVEARYSLAARAADLATLLATIQRPAARLPLAAPDESTSASKLAPLTTNARQAEDEFVPLVLNWLVSEPFNGSGGHTTLFRMIKHLVEFGHECHIYVIPLHVMHDYSPIQLRHYVDQHFMATGAYFHRWTGSVQEADATFATYWKTVPELLKLATPGRRYYLVQDFEPYFFPMGAEYVQAENTYRQGLHCITIGPWLAKLLRQQYQAEADAFDFAVDREVYQPLSLPRPSHARVAFYARPSTPRRAYELGIEALRLVKAQMPEAEIILYGANQLEPAPSFTHTNLGLRNQYELAALYATCDVGLVLSLTNPSLVPFELMACRCAVVDIASERVAGLLEHGQNAMLAEPTPEKIAEAVLRLLWDKPLRQAIVERAYQQTRQLAWSQSARQIEAVLLRHAPPPEERYAKRRLQKRDADTLLWQIHRLLDRAEDDRAQVTQLQASLTRALIEKAQLANQVQQMEAERAAVQSNIASQVRQSSQVLVDGARAGAPIWLLGHQPLSRLPITVEPLWQRFTADRAQLCRIELLFAARHPLHTGSIRFALYEATDGTKNGEGQLLAVHTIAAAEIQPDQPYGLNFAAQPHSYGRTYTFSLALTDATGATPYGVWRCWTPLHSGSSLQHKGRSLRGQVAFQAFYEEQLELVPARGGPPGWGEPLRFRPTVIKQQTTRTAGEAWRLTQQARAALRKHGLKGLLTEAANYVRWQMLRSNGR